MKLSENHGVRRTPKVPAREVLHASEEPEFKFDPSVHLTDQDWQNAADELKGYRINDIRNGALGMVYFETLIDPERCEQELNSHWMPEVKAWFEKLGTTQSAQAVDDMQKLGIIHRLETMLAGRNLFPQQSKFTVDPADLHRLDQSRATVFDAVRQAVAALELEYFRLQCPEQLSKTTPPKPSFTPEHIPVLIKSIRTNLLQYKHPGDWRKVIHQMAMLRVISPEVFHNLELGQDFWKKAVAMLDILHRESVPTFTFFRYASYLAMLAADEVKLDAKGNIVLEKGKKVKLGNRTPLPQRDVT